MERHGGRKARPVGSTAPPRKPFEHDMTDKPNDNNDDSDNDCTNFEHTMSRIRNA